MYLQEFHKVCLDEPKNLLSPLAYAVLLRNQIGFPMISGVLSK